MGGRIMSKTACVTGGTGFIASALVKLLLENGYTVHTTSRNPDDTAKLAPLVALRSIGELKIFRADLKDEGSFDEAIKGCDYVFHVAIPDGALTNEDVEVLIKSAVEGTTNVLRACVKAKATVKRVVYTSSGGAVSANQLDGTGLVVDEESWSDVDFLTTARPPSWGYLMAKILSEKEAWKFAKENNLDLVTVNPVMVTGPSSNAEPPFGARLPLALLTGEEFHANALKTMEKVSGSISIVHLDDVCRAHLFVAETEAASGRYIVATVNTGMRELACFLRNRYAEYYKRNVQVEDVAEKPKLALSSEKLLKAGFQFKRKTIEDIYDDAVAYGKKVGMLHPNIMEGST